MGILQSLSKFVFDRTVALEAAFVSAHPKIVAGTYTADLLVKDSSKLWVDGIDGFSQLFPLLPSDTVPITYKTVGSASPSNFSELVNPAFYPSGSPLKDTGLIPLTGGAATASATTITAQADGTLLISMTVKGQNSGEWYQDVVSYSDTASKVHPVVVLQIRVT